MVTKTIHSTNYIRNILNIPMKDFIGIFKVSHKNKELINELYRFNTLLPTYTQFGNSFGRIRTLLTCSYHDVADYISSNYTLSELFGDNGKYTKIGQNFKIYKTKVCNAHSLYSGIYYIPYNNKVLEEVITKEYLVTSRSYKNKPYYQVYTTSQQDVEQLLSLCNEPENCIIEHGNINMNTLPEMKSILNIIGKKLGNVCSKSLGHSGIYITNTNITIRVVPTIAANTTVVVSLISNINDIDRENITSILRTNGVYTNVRTWAYDDTIGITGYKITITKNLSYILDLLLMAGYIPKHFNIMLTNKGSHTRIISET